MNTITVDDRELVVSLMLSILRKIDPDGTHLGACSSKEALRLAQENPLDVAFLDVEMPGEMNGLSLGKKLKSRYPRLNIVIITGHAEYAIDAFSLDASGYLLKPLTQEAVAHQLTVLRFGQEKPRQGM
ncbi:MAG: LytR/AlgR family response regulator transcription factor, partial [Prevotella sp.]